MDTFVAAGRAVDVYLKIYGPLSINDVEEGRFENHIVSEEVTLNIGKPKTDEIVTTTMDNSYDNNEGTKDSETSLSYTYHFAATSEGTYGFCLDNRKARFTDKSAQIDIYPPNRADPDDFMLKSFPLLSTGSNGDNNIDFGNGGYDLTDHGVKDSSRSSSSGSSTTTTTGKRTDNFKDEEKSQVKVKVMLEALQNGLSQIQSQQQRDRRRLAYHNKNNNDTDRRVVMSSLVETAFFIGASLFQIFFVRRWFIGRQTTSHRV